MNVYVDSSIVMRRLRREAASVRAWGEWDRAYASVLLRVETFRTIDRIRLSGRLDDHGVVELLSDARAILESIALVPLSGPILERASQSFLTALGTLDALHLATALRLVESSAMELTFLTHDTELATAARSMNFKVEGA
jgi:predicted nucleic acid-binding protein